MRKLAVACGERAMPATDLERESKRAPGKPAYQRIVLKLSGEMLGGESGQGIDTKQVASLCEQIVALRDLDVEIALVGIDERVVHTDIR